MSEELSRESLAKSEKVIGQLYPVLVNKEGKVLEGHHRLASNPKWKKKVVETKTPIEDILVRMHAHHRRRIPQEETRTLLIALAQQLKNAGIKKENIASEIVKIAPYSEGYIQRLLPYEYKKPEKVEAGKISAHISQQKAILASLVECARCHEGRRDTVEYKGENLCPKCLELAKYKPEKRAVEISKPKVEVKTHKPKESWAQRKAVMTPQVSKMEETVLIKLEQKGLHPQAQKQFCLRSTTPDYYFPRQNLACYLDGPVHKGREDRDEAIRELLTKRYGVRVVSIGYEGSSEATINKIVNDIVEATK